MWVVAAHAHAPTPAPSCALFRTYRRLCVCVRASVRAYGWVVVDVCVRALQALKEEVSKVCGGAEVFEKPGHIEVVGDFKEPLRAYLAGLGF